MEETKRCPYCGEEILAVARKCKHCGEWQNGNYVDKVRPSKDVQNAKRIKSPKEKNVQIWTYIIGFIVYGTIVTEVIDKSFLAESGTIVYVGYRIFAVIVPTLITDFVLRKSLFKGNKT